MGIAISIDQIRRDKTKKFLSENQLSVRKLAGICGIFPSNLSPILSGNKRFTDKLAAIIEEKFGLKSGYLSEIDDVTKNAHITAEIIPYLDVKIIKNDLVLEKSGNFLSFDPDQLKEISYPINSIFAIRKDVDIDRKALDKSINVNKALIFYNGDLTLANNKFYLIKFANKFLLRRYFSEKSNSGNFETDYPELYASIQYNKDNVEIIARLIFSYIDLQAY